MERNSNNNASRTAALPMGMSGCDDGENEEGWMDGFGTGSGWGSFQKCDAANGSEGAMYIKGGGL
jgi:hypothetical protein